MKHKNTQTGYAKILGTQFYYEMCGEGPDVVLLHGNPLDLTMWDYQVDAFSNHYRVLRIDLRGFGRSGNPGPEGYSHAADLKSLLDHFEIKQIIPIGLSMGGGAAINFAAAYPEMTRALVAADPSLGGYQWSPEFSAGFAGMAALGKEKGIQAVRDAMLDIPIFKIACEKPQLKKKITEMLNNYKAWHWMNRDNGIPLKPPAIERLGEIKVPALAIVGEYDIPDFHNIVNILAEKIPNAKKVVMEEIGHIVNMEAPDKFNRIVLEFLRGIKE